MTTQTGWTARARARQLPPKPLDERQPADITHGREWTIADLQARVAREVATLDRADNPDDATARVISRLVH